MAPVTARSSRCCDPTASISSGSTAATWARPCAEARSRRWTSPSPGARRPPLRRNKPRWAPDNRPSRSTPWSAAPRRSRWTPRCTRPPHRMSRSSTSSIRPSLSTRATPQRAGGRPGRRTTSSATRRLKPPTPTNWPWRPAGWNQAQNPAARKSAMPTAPAPPLWGPPSRGCEPHRRPRAWTRMNWRDS